MPKFKKEELKAPKFKKEELEACSLSTLMALCSQEGLSNEGDKDTLIARLLATEPTEPEP